MLHSVFARSLVVLWRFTSHTFLYATPGSRRNAVSFHLVLHHAHVGETSRKATWRDHCGQKIRLLRLHLRFQVEKIFHFYSCDWYLEKPWTVSAVLNHLKSASDDISMGMLRFKVSENQTDTALRFSGISEMFWCIRNKSQKVKGVHPTRLRFKSSPEDQSSAATRTFSDSNINLSLDSRFLG